MDAHDEPGTFVRLSVDGAEVCWAESLGGGLAKVANLTGRDDYRLGDVVEYALEDGGRAILRRVGPPAGVAKPA